MNASKKALKVLKILFFVGLFVLVAGYGTMALWNWLVPTLFHGPVVTFGQALGLLVLGRILTGFKPGGWGRDRRGFGPPWANRKMMRQKMESRLASMTEEQRAEFRARMARCGPRWARWTGTDETEAVPTNQPG